MLLGKESDPCVIWACGPDLGEIWRQASIVGEPDERWQWITLNKGSLEGLRRGLFLSIHRGSRKIASAEVDRVSERSSVAWILKGTMSEHDEPRLGDEVRVIA